MGEIKRLVSGIQPTGTMHLGNFLGAIQSWASLQDNYDSIFLIVDLHALTTIYENPKKLTIDRWNLAVDLLATGVDPNKSILCNQSDVPEHCELHLILSMMTPTPWLNRVPSYKSKCAQLKDKNLNSYGFLGYPVLQTADILLYKGDVVPVGEDQLPHLELAREIARRFNHLYKSIFPEPGPLLTKTPMLPGIDGQKMSKSYANTIAISDTPESIKSKVMKMFTDPNRIKKDDPGNPDICPVFTYHKIFNTPDVSAQINTACREGLIGCVTCKKRCSEQLIETLAPLQKNRASLLKNKDYIQKVLDDGSKKARQIALETLSTVKHAIGLI